MSDYGEMYIRKLKERFAALAATPAWERIEAICWAFSDDDDDSGFTALSNVCVQLSQLQGLPFGPRQCPECGVALAGDFGRASACLVCADRAREQAQREAERKQRWSQLTPEEQAEVMRWQRIALAGLIKRNVP